MNKMNIGEFSLWTKEPNTIYQGGHLFVKEFDFDTKNRFKKRLVRVYLPSNYEFDNPNKRFKVIYMLDGKNIFDDYTSFVGEWGFDEEMEDMIIDGEIEGYIVVGIDAPNDGDDRTLEMSPENIHFKKEITHKDNIGYGTKLGDFIFKVVKPEVDALFHTRKEKENTIIGGSSMGGISSFYLALFYNEYVGSVLAYSPAFFLYVHEEFKKLLDSKISNVKLDKIYLYTGGTGFEAVFIKDTFYVYNYLKEHGYNDNQVKLVYLKEAEHNEKAWNKYIKDALRFLNS